MLSSLGGVVTDQVSACWHSVVRLTKWLTADHEYCEDDNGR